MQDMRRARVQARVVLLTVYAALALLLITEQWGRTTNDTRIELTEGPGRFLAETLRLWSPDVSLGELQNQAYGYLFPQGPFFALLDQLAVPGWLTQRLWSVLLLLLACEGARRVALVLGTGPWAAAAAGLAYGLVPRQVTELGVRSAEILPAVMLPWALLPVLLALHGRMRPRHAAVLSAAAFACSGGVNGTATAAPAALLAIVVGWAVWRRRLSWRFGAGWLALIGAVSLWWAIALLRLGAYSPPFFDFVEDARTTTGTSGAAASLRGASNWVGYLTVGGERWWPAGYDLSYQPWLVLGSGLVAVLGVLGLLRMRGPLRTPFLLAVAFGLACQVIAHTGPLGSPVGQLLQDLLDGPLAPLRNVAKADPVLRLPLCLGVGVLADDALRLLAARARRGRAGRARRLGAAGLLLALVGGLLACAQPIAAADTRTPGWDAVPDHWPEAAAFLERRAGRAGAEGPDGSAAGATWVIPGAGFGIQQWGWTMEEPLETLARSPWLTRSQVPLAPPQTIRVLSALESYLETGSGSPYLRAMLSRLGIDTVLVRHDLDPRVAQVTSGNLVAVALARSPGLDRIATFGALTFGPAIEVFEVRPVAGSPTSTQGYDVRDSADAVRVAGSVEAAVAAVGSGLVAPQQPVLLAADGEEADVVGDGYRLRERAFGRVHDAESNVMADGEPYRAGRVLPNYPGAPGTTPVVSRYEGIAGVDASGSRGWADTLGPVLPENAPWSALDGDPSTYWRPGPFTDAAGAWLEVRLPHARRIGEVDLTEPLSRLDVDHAGTWRVSAGGTSRIVRTDALTGHGSVELDVRADRVRIEAVDPPSRQAAVGLAEVAIEGVRPTRTLVVPPVEGPESPDLLFAAAPAIRACVTTLLGPDCEPERRRPSEEETGIDRTFTVDRAGTWEVSGLTVTRARPGTVELLQPSAGPRLTGSSWLAEDPAVSPRMAHDGDPATSWVADPRDPEPTLTIDLGRVRTLSRIAVTAPAGIAVLPDRAVIRAETSDGEVVREADLRGVGAFEPVRARRLTVTFGRRASGDLPIGVGEVTLGGARLAVPLDGAQPTGAVCGYGPELVVDGRTVPTRVEGLVGDVVGNGRLAVVPCGTDGDEGAGVLDLGAGEHRVALRSTEQFQPVGLTLSARRDAARPVADRSRDLRLLSSSRAEVRLRIGPGERAILSAPHNVNAGWVATLDGRRLDPITVDGWAQGWVVPADLAGDVRLSFQPERGYLIGLVGGLVLLGLVLLWALAILTAGLRRPSPEPMGDIPYDAPRHRRSRAAAAGIVAGAALLGLLVGGPLAALGATAGVLLATRWRLVQGLAGLGLLGALIALVVLLADGGPRRPPAAVDLVTATALALALAAGLSRPGPSATEERP